MDIPAIIADLRRGGLTQAQIAAGAGIAQSTVSQLGSGARGKRPSAQTVDALRLLWERERRLRGEVQ